MAAAASQSCNRRTPRPRPENRKTANQPDDDGATAFRWSEGSPTRVTAGPRGLLALARLPEDFSNPFGQPVHFRVQAFRAAADKSAPFNKRNASGASKASRNTGTRIPRRLASDASLLTHSDETEARTTARFQAPGGADLVLDDFVKGLTEGNLPVPPDRPATPSESLRERLRAQSILGRIADKDVCHYFGRGNAIVNVSGQWRKALSDIQLVFADLRAFQFAIPGSFVPAKCLDAPLAGGDDSDSEPHLTRSLTYGGLFTCRGRARPARADPRSATTQDSPILGDVWAEFAAKPAAVIDPLISPIEPIRPARWRRNNR